MSLRLILISFFLLCRFNSHAQISNNYIQPEYKIRLRDTTGTYLQVQNYFDRTYYKYNIYLKEILSDGTSRYAKIDIDTVTGLGLIPNNFVGIRNVQIQRSLEIQDVSIKKDAVNRIEIRNEQGFFNVYYSNYISNQQLTWMKVINTYTKDSFETKVPANISLPKGKYEIRFKTNPVIKRTVYIKPAQITTRGIYRCIPIQFLGLNSETEIVVHRYYYGDKVYKKIFTTKTSIVDPVYYFLPKAKYKISYRRKGKKRFRTDTFYLRTDMQKFIKTLK